MRTVLLVIAGLACTCGPSLAQTVALYMADTSYYDTPAFKLIDAYVAASAGCRRFGELQTSVTGTTIRLAIPLVPYADCRASDAVLNSVVRLRSPVPAGRYAVEFGYLLDGAWIPRATNTLDVDDGQQKCSRIPEANIVLAAPASEESAQWIIAVVVNPALDRPLFEILGKPIGVDHRYVGSPVALYYHPLDDAHRIAAEISARSEATGLTYAEPNGFACFATSLPVPLRIVEYFNTRLGHYFLTSSDSEIAYVDSGGAGPGWQRTGEQFSGMEANFCTAYSSNPTPVYRFYGTPGRGPNSHFFTADRRECGAVRGDPGWTFESAPFRVWAPIFGNCPSGSVAFTRLYNGRAAQNDTNHRYTMKASIVEQMVAAGWKNEGVAFCVPRG